MEEVSADSRQGVGMTRSEILERLHATGKRVLLVSDLIRAGVFGDRSVSAVYIRFSGLPAGERPLDHGAIKAGGATAWLSPDSAADFVEHHNAYWRERMEAR